MNTFLPYFIASALVAGAWTILALTLYRRQRRLVGLVGAWAGTLVLTSLWLSDALPWVLELLPGVVFAWLGAIGLMIIAGVLILIAKEPGRGPLLGCAALTILINVVAGLHFLWLATVSPGGV